MSQLNNNTTQKKFQHLNFEERKILQRLINEGVSQAKISRLLRRDKSTISREIARGTVEQIRKNPYESKRTDHKEYFCYQKYIWGRFSRHDI